MCPSIRYNTIIYPSNGYKPLIYLNFGHKALFIHPVDNEHYHPIVEGKDRTDDSQT
jgi:hypothetical protein